MPPEPSQSPASITIGSGNPEGNAAAFQLALGAHTLATQIAAEARMHQNECVATRVRNESVFTEIKENISVVDTKLDQQTLMLIQKIDTKHSELSTIIENKNQVVSQDQKNSNRILYLMIGGITVLGNMSSIAKLLGLFHN